MVGRSRPRVDAAECPGSTDKSTLPVAATIALARQDTLLVSRCDTNSFCSSRSAPRARSHALVASAGRIDPRCVPRPEDR